MRTGCLNAPPAVLLNAIQKLQANHCRGKINFPRYLSTFDRPEFQRFKRETAGPDRLFKPDYTHIGGASCRGCTSEWLVERTPRTSSHPVFHYGTIACGNQVMKDGIARDRKSSELGGVLCFEMEAAGLMNIFPFLVIRGISDYADSHKNDEWQPFAAATAAACAKEILSIIPAAEVDGTRTIREADTDERRLYLDSLRFDEFDARRENIQKAHAQTCRWLLEKPEYQQWHDDEKLSQHKGLLWIKGKPGTGKSTIMKFAYTNAMKTMNDNFIISFFFNARGGYLERSTTGMYRSLLVQLLEKLPELQAIFDSLRPMQTCRGEPIRQGAEPVKKLFRAAIEKLGRYRLTCFIDALDECKEDEVRDMVAFFEELTTQAVDLDIRLFVCFSSRHYPHISVDTGIELVLEGQEGHSHDMVRYLRSELKAGRSKLSDQIRAEILERASGIFLSVVLGL